MTRSAGERLDRSRYELELEDSFGGSTLDGARWVPHYLPQWSTPDRTEARYDLRDGRLRLLIEADHPPWCPEFDGDVRVSSIQTGVHAGPIGSSIGQDRFHPGVIVRTAQANRAPYAPRSGLIEVRARALADPRAMVALWMIGIEDEPRHSAETSTDWTPDLATWYVDDALVRIVRQPPAYPMQLMLSHYQFPVEGDVQSPADYPKAFEVDWVRGFRLGMRRHPA